MQDKNRRAIVTPETKAESVRLREIWDSRSHPGQAEFGELYEIGNQSAVSQFLLGRAPLSLKAAKGFATGLGCRIEDFSPRLAKEAADIAGLVLEKTIAPQVAELANAINSLPERQREWTLKRCWDAVQAMRDVSAIAPPSGNGVSQNDSGPPDTHQSEVPRRRHAAR